MNNGVLIAIILIALLCPLSMLLMHRGHRHQGHGKDTPGKASRKTGADPGAGSTPHAAPITGGPR